MGIKENVERIKENIPAEVYILAATKGRSIEEIEKAIEAGIDIIGENYIQEAEQKIEYIGGRVDWHFIGHLQKNKVKKAVKMFNVIETVDSLNLIISPNSPCASPLASRTHSPFG